jgi:adenylate cyclase
MRKAIAAGVIGVSAAVLVLALVELTAALSATELSPFDTVELKSYDWRMRQVARPQDARQDIALVEIDETSLRNLEPLTGRWPWPRFVHALLIQYLSRGPAKLIAYDINFAGDDTHPEVVFGNFRTSGHDSDEALVDAVKSAGNVVVLEDATLEDDRPRGVEPPPDIGYALDLEGILPRTTIFPPFKSLAGAAATIGHNLFWSDADGPIRHTVPFVRSGGRALPSLGTAAALRVAGISPTAVRLEGGVLHMGDRAMPLQWRRVQVAGGTSEALWGLIRFRGPKWSADMQSRIYPTYSFADLLASEQKIQNSGRPDIDPSVFRDKVVFVGTTAASLNDVFETPFAHGGMPGISVHAAVADDILSNRFMRVAPEGVRVASVLVAGILVGSIATLLPAWWATAASILIVALFGWTSTRLFANGYWLNIVQPVLAAAIALFAGVGYQYFVEGREKRKMKRLFGQYVSKDVYDQLVAHPELARLGGSRREMTVLFSDIRGFTTITERGQPEAIVALLNEYFTRMVDIVFRHHGTLDKFVGDMVMALFGAPVDDPLHAEHAVAAALEMTEELQRLNDQWKAAGRFADLDIGIGINTGPMIAGNIGSEAIMSYTVIGDAVNLGSRLESLNKQYGTRIIISDATRQQLNGAYRLRPLGDVVVKGKSQPVAIFELLGRADTTTESSMTRGDNARGVTREAQT